MTDISYRPEYKRWSDALDQQVQATVDREVNKLLLGVGRQRKLKGVDGVREIKIKNPPLRVYYREQDDGRIEILCGGKKDDQDRSIKIVKGMI